MVNGAQGDGAGAPIFVIGSGRSGNTLIRRVLMASGRIYIPPETYVVGEIIAAWRRWALLPWRERVWLFCAYFERHEHFSTFGTPSLSELAARLTTLTPGNRTLRAMFEGYYAYFAERAGYAGARWGDKTPYNTYYLREIGRAFPDAQFVSVRRNGLDVVASYVKAGLYDSPARAAERWVAANAACEKFRVRNPARVFSLDYDEMVARPGQTFSAMYAFLGEAFDERFLTEAPADMGDVEMLRHHKNTRAPISPAYSGRGADSLGKDALASLPEDFWATMRAYGYSEGAAATA